jgi:hypothetical protein
MTMRKYLLAGLVIGVWALPGCATMSKTAEENQRAWGQQLDIEMRELGDDWNYVLMADRPNRLSKYQIR